MNDLLDQLQTLGFDRSRPHPEGGALPRCSRCEALVVSRRPIHERGCPNSPREEGAG